MSQLIITFGKRLQYLRKQAGLTQEKLADKINISIDSVSNIERGIQNPKLDTLEKIAQAFNIKLKDLFDFDDEK